MVPPLGPPSSTSVPELLSENSPLQNGEYPEPEGRGPTARLHGEIESTRYISDSPNAMQVSPFLLEGSGLRVPSPPVWPSSSPTSLYIVPQAHVRFSPGKTSMDHHLPR